MTPYKTGFLHIVYKLLRGEEEASRTGKMMEWFKNERNFILESRTW
jgi:hypothetical protein